MHTRSRLVLCGFVGLTTALSLGCSDEGAGEAGGGQTATSQASSSQAGGQVAASSSSSAAGSSSVAGSSSSSSSSAAAGSSGGASSTSTRTGGAGAGGTTTVATSSAVETGGTTPGGKTSTGTGGRTGGRTGGATASPGGTTGSAGAPGGATGSIPPNTTGPSGILVPPRKYFGNIDTRGAIRSDFKSMWDQFSPENAGKWGSVQGGGQNSFSWNSLDTMYKYCQDNGVLFKEHTFCWGPQQPSWVNDTNGTTAVKAWMKAFCERYPKTVMIDVFNESLHNSPQYKNGIGGAGTSGYDYLVNAFKWAREACPTQILLYNDYNTIEYSNENNGVIKLVKAIKAAGAPIDGVGCQAHDVGLVSAATVKSYTEKIIAETGLPVYITEMDVGKADDAQQLASVKGVVEALWNNEMVKGWTYWGYLQGATWRANTHLLLSSGAKRSALTWLLEYTKH